MGLGASKQDSVDSNSSTTGNEHDDNDCHCFLFPAPTRQKSDTLGTPLPQTFRKRSTLPEAPPPTRGVRGRESSRYGGLEVSIGAAGSNNDSNNNGSYINGDTGLPAAVIHEGKVRHAHTGIYNSGCLIVSQCILIIYLCIYYTCIECRIGITRKV